MPEFTYKALTAEGKHASGIHSAPTQAAAMDQLVTQGMFVTTIAPAAEPGKGKSAAFTLPFCPIVSSAELVLMIRRMATLVSSGIPLAEALKALCGQVESANFKQILHEVTDDVQEGKALSKAMARHKKVFPEIMICMVRVGEAGGILPTVLEQLADFMERDREVRSEVKAAMAYPSLVLLVAFGTIIFLMTTAVPKLKVMFESMDESLLPMPTKILLAVSGSMTTQGLWLLGIIAIIFTVLSRWKKSATGRRFFDQAHLSIPLIGKLNRHAAIARFTRSLGALLKGGVPLMEALEVVKRILDNQVMNEAVERMKERVRKGHGMSKGLEGEKLFPEMVRYMIAAGENSGALDDMLLKIADVYEMETRNTVKMLLGLLAPLLILMVAGVVGFIAMAMLMPIFKLNQMI